MNQELYERAKKIIDNLTPQEIYDRLVAAGYPADGVSIRQFPEIPDEILAARRKQAEPYRHPFLTIGSFDE